jgi:hypothetical protein
MKRAKLIFLVLILLAVGLYLKSKEPVDIKEFRNSLCQAVHAKPASSIKLSNLTKFEWEKVYIFGPYTPKEKVESDLGFKWNGFNETGISSDDSTNLLLFLSKDNGVKWAKIPRNCGDFEISSDKNVITRNNDEFVVTEENRGEPWLILKPLGKM